ncbi:hypothetical protein F889_03469 [Acinetobacter colistiniresistens]|uniref:Autotransporter adhesin n=1 Tax=Acinetobacter colistiniresistens TaxID=280145 RepID=N9R008_9GAMM|nr:ESPR-type extended signal peptide-containing protein [Acinetobacter colistiniresistens]ENX32487.1 hypothetical protein F889_03469 [Acinetobacter colistiniresistens]
MNKIYRVVWSKSLNLWIVVSENARGVTKKRNVSLMDCSETVDQESLETFSVLIPKLLTIAVSTIFFSISVAVAAVNTGGGTVSNNGSGNSMAISPTGQQCGNAGQATVNGNSGVAVGCGNNISGTDEAFAQALNNRRGTGSNNYPTGVASITSASTAVGKSNRITGVGGATVVGNANISDGSNFHNVAIGQGNRTGGAGYNTALGIGNDANGGNSNVVIGVDNRARSNTAIAMGRGAWADADFSIAQGATATVVQGATSGIALGNSATTKGARGIAIGSATAVNSQYDAATAPNADGADSIAIGTGAKGTGASSTAVGRQAVASGDSSTAMGELAKADNNGDLALGANAHATGVTRDGSTYSAVAVGRNALAQGEDALAVGNSAKATANYAGAVGNFAEASAQNAMAVGNSAKASGNFSSAFGNFSEASGMQSTANGNRAKATADFSSAYGNIAEASGVQSSAIGNSSKASGTRSSAFGDNTKAVGTGSVATGSNTQAMGESSVAMGDSAQAQGDNDIAIGRNAVTASGNSNNIAVGSEVTTGNMGQNVAMGSDGTNANSRTADGGAVAIGRAQTATGNGAVAIGDPNRANGDGAVAMGRNNTAAGNYDASEAGNGAVAIGNENQAIGQGSVALGNTSTAAAAGAIALGDTANAQATRGVALGSDATATNADDVALGAGSVTSAANPTANGTVGGLTYNYAGTSPSSVVSVGSAGNERQVTNVAAGRVSESSTDAINGSQLYSTQTALGNLAESTANHLGGGSTVNPDGTVSAPSYSVNGNNVSNVGDAITELDKGWNLQSNGANAGAIKAGDTVDIGTAAGEENLTVTKNGNTIQYGLNKDLKVDSVTAGDTVINDNGVSITNGPSITKSGINAAGNPITNVGAGVNGTDAVNKDQLDNAAAAAKTEVTEGKNITVTKTTGADGQDIYNVATADDVDFNKVTVGDVTIDGTTGKISGVAAGDVNSTSTDAINGSQLAGTAKSVSDALGGGSTVNPDGTVTAPSYDINGTTVSNVGDAITELDKGWNLQSNGANAGAIKAGDTVDIGTVAGEENLTVTKTGNEIKYGLNKDLKVDSVTAGDTVINDNGMTITNGPSITKSGINAAGNKITNVADGTAGTDAVNKGQLDKAAAASKTEVTEGKNITVTKSTGADGQDIYNVATANDVDFNNVTVGGANGVRIDGTTGKISGVTAGDVNPTSTDAINGSQLAGTAKSVSDALGGGSVVNPDGTVSAPSYSVNGNNVSNVGDAITELDKGWNLQSNGAKAAAIKAGDTVDIGTVANEENLTVTKNGNTIQYGLNKDLKVDSVTAGDTVINDNGVSITNGPSITKSGINAAGNPITNVGAGVNGTDAVNKDQLDNAAAAAKTEVTEGKNITVTKTTGADGQDIYNVATADDVDFNKVTVGDVTIDGATGKISGIAAGDVNATSTDAINGSQLAGTAKSVSDALGGGSTVNPDGTVSAPSYTVNGNNVTNVGAAISELDKGWNLQSNGANAAAIKAGDTVDIGTVAGEENLTVTKTGNEIKYGLSRDLKVDSVTAGDTVINDNGVTITNGPSITKSGINAAGNPITNVGAGVNGTDAVNKDQLDNAAATAKTEVTEGKNITVTKTTGADGQDIYNVATANDVDFNNVTVGGSNGVRIDGTTGKISGVTAGTIAAGSTEAINGSQLNDSVASTGDILGGGVTNEGGRLNGPFTVNDKGYDTVADAIQGETAAAKTEVEAGKNMTVTNRTGADGQTIYEVATANDVSFDSVKVGDINLDGSTGKISGVADGTIAAGSTEAINGGQLHGVADSVRSSIGGETVLNPNGSVTTSNVGNTGESNIHDAIDSVRKNAVSAKTTVTEGDNMVVMQSSNPDGSTNYEVATAKDVKFDSVTATDEDGNETILTGKGVSLKDQAGNTTVLGQDGLGFVDPMGNSVGPRITAGGINAGNTVITGVAPGRIAADSQDAINGSQLKGVSDSVAGAIGGNTTVNPDGTIITSDIGGTGKDNINDAIGAVGKAAQEAKSTVSEGKNIVVKESKNVDGSTDYEVSTAPDLEVDSVTAGGTKVDGDGLHITGGPSVTKAGINAGDSKVTGVADGTVAAGSQDAINGGQLHGVADSVKNVVGGNATVNPDGSISTSNIGGTGKDNINDAIGSIGQAAQAAKTSVSNKDGNITVNKTTNAEGRDDYEVGLAKDITVDSVTAKDVNANQVNVGGAGGTTIAADGVRIAEGPSMTKDGINAGGKKVTGVADGVIASGSQEGINGGQLHRSYEDVGKALGGGAGYDPNTGWKGPSYEVAGGKYDNVGDALGAVDNRVTNLGDQLQQAFYDTNKRMDKLEDKMSAGIAATAALENAPFIPGKLTMAAGAAYYNDQSAIGVTFRKTADNGRWSLTTGAAMGSQGNSPLVRVGVSTIID